jgi:hypothetical protein
MASLGDGVTVAQCHAVREVSLSLAAEKVLQKLQRTGEQVARASDVWLRRMENLLQRFSPEELWNQLVFLGAEYDSLL